MSRLLLAAVLVPQLAFVALNDLRHWRIHNRANVGLAVTYLCFAAVLADLATLFVHALFAASAFLLLLWPFTKGWLGGGDVKFLTAAFLWVGPFCVSTFSFALLLAMLVYLILARLNFAPAKRVGRMHRVPLGPMGAFALAITLILCPPF